jgi:hypothetical protein
MPIDNHDQRGFLAYAYMLSVNDLPDEDANSKAA